MVCSNRRDDLSGDKQAGTILNEVGSRLSQLTCPLGGDFVQGTEN
jgi:hypothetical protein